MFGSHAGRDVLIGGENRWHLFQRHIPEAMAYHGKLLITEMVAASGGTLGQLLDLTSEIRFLYDHFADIRDTEEAKAEMIKFLTTMPHQN